MAGKAASKTLNDNQDISTNQVAQLSEDEQWAELCNIAFGESWEEFKSEIRGRLADFDENAAIVQSTNRALETIKTMMFDRV